MLGIAMLAGITLLACTWAYQRSRPSIDRGASIIKERAKSRIALARPSAADLGGRAEADPAADAMRKGRFTDPVDVWRPFDRPRGRVRARALRACSGAATRPYQAPAALYTDSKA